MAGRENTAGDWAETLALSHAGGPGFRADRCVQSVEAWREFYAAYRDTLTRCGWRSREAEAAAFDACSRQWVRALPMPATGGDGCAHCGREIFAAVYETQPNGSAAFCRRECRDDWRSIHQAQAVDTLRRVLAGLIPRPGSGAPR